MGLESYFTSGQKSEVVDGGMRNGDAAKSEKVNTPESLRNVRCLRGPDSGRGARGYKLPHEMERVFKAFRIHPQHQQQFHPQLYPQFHQSSLIRHRTHTQHPRRYPLHCLHHAFEPLAYRQHHLLVGLMPR